MRVLHVHSGNLYGGVETFLITMARCRHLTPSMEMAVALCFDGRIGDELRSEGVQTPMLGEVRLRRPDTVWRARQALDALLKRDRYDVVVCHQAWPLAIFGSVARAQGVPLVSWLHMDQSGHHWLERLAARVHPDLTICNSRFTASSLPKTTSRVEWIHYPAMPIEGQVSKTRAEVRRELQTDPDDVVIVQVSRMEPLKGQAVCIEALALLRDRPGWTCWQVGGAQREAEVRYVDGLRASAERHGVLGRIRFAGQRSDVPDLLMAADIFCQPNMQPDAFGLSFVEALSAGLPVVTSGIGGALEIVDDTCGILPPPGDAHALAEALRRLLDNRAERERFGHAGRLRAHALCDPQRQMTRISEVLESVCAPKEGPAGHLPSPRPGGAQPLRTMRVLRVHSGNLYGGVETSLLTMARCRHLAPSMEMSVALCFEGRIAEELRAEGVPTLMLGEVRLRRPDTVWRARRALEAALQRDRYDVVVCHQAWPMVIFGPVVKAAGVPLVLWVHMDQSGRTWLERLASRVHPDLIICNSRFTASTLPPQTARVEWICPPVLPIDRAALKPRADVRKELQTDPDDVVIVQVSRMEAWKGQSVCVEALALLRDRPNWTCWQVGGAQRSVEAQYLDTVRGAAERLGVLNRIRFAGQRSDVPDLLAAADIFCQPNLEPDAFGRCFVEALSAGLPVVTSGIGGALEVVDDTCGILTPPGDTHALSAALVRLLDDQGERERLGQSGPRRARAVCDPLTQMTRIAETLETVCRGLVH